MERVKPLDYNENEKSITNCETCKHFNCSKCCSCCCFLCLKNKNQPGKNLVSNCSESSASSIHRVHHQEPSNETITKSITIKSSTHNNSNAKFNTKIHTKTTTTTTTSSAADADGMTILVTDDIPTLPIKKKISKVENMSENQSINNIKRKNISFVVPNSTTIENAATAATASAAAAPVVNKPIRKTRKKHVIVHEYENIPPLKPKRMNLPGTSSNSFNITSSIQENYKSKKMSTKKKKQKKYMKIFNNTTTTLATTTATLGYDNHIDNDDGDYGAGTFVKEKIKKNIKKENNDNQKEVIINNSSGINREHEFKLRLSQGCTSLMHACLQGNIGTAVQELRTKPEKVHRRDRKNKNVLHYCSSCRKNTDLVAAASVAVRAPELLESADEDGFTPLHLAVIQGNLAMVNLLLANKADVNAVDNEGHSVVHWATVCGEIEALRAVLQAGASVTKPDINGGSPLHYAAQMCGAHYEGKLNQATSSKLALEILTILLNHPQSSVDVTDKDGRQPLLWAASAGSAKAVIALVKAGARVESSDKDGLTALHCAASRGHTECIDTLISLCGAPTDLIDSNGCTALHYAVTLGHADATSRLLDLEADPNRQDRKGRTPAHCGCAKGQLETVKLLKERGASLWLRNAKGDLPLHEAASSGRRELVEWLLDQRPKQVNTTSNDGRTMLHIAANNDYTDMCKMLIDFGADINCIYRNSKGVAMTPLDCSLQKGYRSTAKFLQSNSGLPASKLRLSGRRPNAFNDQELVKPLKYAEKEEVHDLKNQKKYIVYAKRSDSESSGCSCSEHWYKKEHHVNHVCKHHRKRLRRRTSSCGEVDEVGNNESSDICRSKSNIEIRRKRSRERVYTSDEGDSCEVCCRHKRRLKSKKKERCHQRRYKEIKYSEDDDDDVKRMRNQRRVEKEKGRYSNKSDSKGNIYIESGSVKQQDDQQDDAERSSPPLEKTQRPQSAKKRRQQTKEGTFIKTPLLDEASGLLDITDEDDIPKSEVVVTEVQVHKEGDESSALSVPPEEKSQDTEEPKALIVEEISKEVNEVLKDATETVEKLTDITTEKPLTETEVEVTLPVVQEEETKIELTKTETGSANAVVEDTPVETSVAGEQKTEPEEKSEEKEIASEEKQAEKTEVAEKEPEPAKETEIVPKETSENAVEKSEEVTEEKVSEANQLVEEQKKEQKPLSEIPSTEQVAEPIVEEPTEQTDTVQVDEKKETISTTQQKDETYEKTEKPNEEQIPKEEEKTEIENKTDIRKPSFVVVSDEDKKVDGDDKVEKTVQIITDDDQENSKLRLTPVEQMSLKTPVEREQESRRSFTLLPDSPVAVSEVDHLQSDDHLQIDDSAVRKSSFTVLKSDESVENYDMQSEDVVHEVDESSFQVVSSPEKPIISNRITYSSEEAAEVGDEEDEEQQGVSGAIFVGNRDGRHSALAGSVSDGSGRRKRLKRRVKSGSKVRGWRSVEADEESPGGQQASRDQDSGFEPSPRATTKSKTYGSFVPKKTIYATIDGRSCSSRLEGRKPGDKNSCNMTAVTKSIHRNIRRYYMERKIFQHLLELKSLQIRSSKLNEAVLVKRAVDDYHKSCIALGAETGGSLRRYPYTEYTFKNFEMFLYETLKSLQKPGTYNFQNINEVYEEAERRLSPDYNTYEKALQCTTKTHRCLHAAHAYTGIPCAAYIPMMNHHTMPKFGFGSYKKSGGVGSFYLPKILTSPVKCGGGGGTSKTTSGAGTRVSLELSHGKTKQLISLPSDKLDSNKRYYVTFTVKGSGEGTVTGSPGKTKIELSSDGKLVQQTDVTPIEK